MTDSNPETSNEPSNASIKAEHPSDLDELLNGVARCPRNSILQITKFALDSSYK